MDYKVQWRGRTEEEVMKDIRSATLKESAKNYGVSMEGKTEDEVRQEVKIVAERAKKRLKELCAMAKALYPSDLSLIHI